MAQGPELDPVGGSSTTYGRCPPPKVNLPHRGTFMGVAWSGAQGAGGQITAALVACEPERAMLTKVSRPFQDAVGRRDVLERFAAWITEASRWAEGRLTIGFDFPFGLAETHLRQLGVLRQAIQGPAALGKALEERFLPPGGDISAAADAIQAEVGREQSRLTDCYRGVPPAPPRSKGMRRTLLGLLALSRVEASFLPWDPPQAGRPTVVEVLPADLPRALAGICSYRDGDGTGRTSVRAAVLRTLRSAARLEFEMEDAAQVVGDGHGLALDAVLAAVAAAAAQEGGFQQVPHNVPRSEGWTYSIPGEPWRG
jgi:hypothetical protein